MHDRWSRAVSTNLWAVYAGNPCVKVKERPVIADDVRRDVTESPTSYGWASTSAPESCGYITPAVLRTIQALGVRRVCDVGSGNGALVAAARDAGLYAVGIEPDRDGVTHSQERLPGVNFYNLSVEDDPAAVLRNEGQPFDVVVSTEVVEHLYRPRLLPTFSRGLLEPGGYLVVSTPYHGYLKNLAVSVANGWDAHHTPLWDGGHIKFWSRATLTRLLEENGFEVVSFSGAGRLPCLNSMIWLGCQRSGALGLPPASRI